MIRGMSQKSELLTELWQYRELLFFLAWRDIKVRYKQAALGAGWALIQPLFSMIVFTLFFGKLAGIASDGIPYPIFSYCALLLWTYFSGVLGQAGQSLVTNSNLITKIYFPRMILPASSAISGLLDLGVGAILLIGLMLYYRISVNWYLLLVPVVVASLFLFTVGTSMLTAALNVRYRDVKYALPFLIQLWLFITPVIYPITLIPQDLQWIAALNPLSGIVEGFRACLFGRQPDPVLISVSLASTLLVFFLGGLYFRRTERAFADFI
jgi:lipopolysaccharide transport system permease protein